MPIVIVHHHYSLLAMNRPFCDPQTHLLVDAHSFIFTCSSGTFSNAFSNPRYPMLTMLQLSIFLCLSLRAGVGLETVPSSRHGWISR